jgi:hypothetical protein
VIDLVGIEVKVAIEKISDPEIFFNSFSLHDVRLESLKLDFLDQSAVLKFNDLNWNYERMPGYVERPCSIVLEGVIAHFVDISDIEGIRIDHNEARAVDGLTRVDFDLNIGGGDSSWGTDRSSISLTFKTMKIVDG